MRPDRDIQRGLEDELRWSPEGVKEVRNEITVGS